MRASKTKTHGLSGCRRSGDYPNWPGFQPHCMTGIKIGDSRLVSFSAGGSPGPASRLGGRPGLAVADLRPRLEPEARDPPLFKSKLTLPLSAHKRHGASGPAQRRQEAGAAESNGPYSRSITFT